MDGQTGCCSQNPTLAIRDVDRDIETDAPLPAMPKADPAWKSSSFWASAATMIVNFAGVLVIFGYIKPNQLDQASTMISAIIMGIGAIVVNGAALFKFLSGQQAVQQMVVEQQLRERESMHTLHVEKLQMRLQMQRAALKLPD